MGKIFYIFGKSASGKDSLYKNLIEDDELGLKPVVLSTTRPKRDGEADGINYFFTDEEKLRSLSNAGRIIEHRLYNTVYGPWHYFLADDGNIDVNKNNYLAIGTLESFCSVKRYYGDSNVIPMYIYVEDGQRLIRAIKREQEQIKPGYAEVCRRFLADNSDFSEDKLRSAGVNNRFENDDYEVCLEALKDEIKSFL